MTIVTKWFKEQAKTVAAFVAGFVGNMLVSLLNGSTAFPQNRAEWTQYLLTSAGAAFAAYMARNKITQKQLDADDHVLGGIVVDEKVAPTVPPHSDHVIVNPATGQVGDIPRSGPYVNPFPDPTGLS